MSKPQVICHMMSTLDGRIISSNWGDEEIINTYSGFFEKYHETFDSNAWICGRITMERDFSKGEKPVLQEPPQPIERKAFIGDKNATSFAVAVDPHGKLGWKENKTYGDHIIEVLTEQVSDDYLYYLQQKKISYLFAGRTSIDFNTVLEQLSELFPIKTLMLEGGGHLNGSLMNEGLVDELSLLLVPIVDGTVGAPTTFEVSEYLHKNPAILMNLQEVTKLDQDVLWLKYRRKR
jgi:riboflavin biosynthesis pyrimidine reductase